MTLILFIFLSYLLVLTNSLKIDNWKIDSWKNKRISQIPEYPDKKILNQVLNKINNFTSIVFAGECDNLKNNIAKASYGQSFLLMGGDCAELFDEFNVNKIRDTYRIILQMGMIFTYGSGLPTIKIGRMAGQFAKPRSEEYETISNKTILTYRGDIINDYSCVNRAPNPYRMISAYQQSIQTLNILRAFSSGGYASLNRFKEWNLNFTNKTKEDSKYRQLSNKINKSLKFINGLGIDTENDIFMKTDFYTGHECLLLPYEEALTRKDTITNNYYDCSAHFLWIGERTRQLDSAHVEFLRGVKNPIGIKLSSNVDFKELLQLIKILNPNNVPGRITLITRMGYQKIKKVLPNLIRNIQNEKLIVTWCCDPMHANTFKTKNGYKSRDINLIKMEILKYFNIHKKMNSFPGGLHLELTGQDITECIGGDVDTIYENDLKKKYLTHCDPRLNSNQALEIAFMVSDLLENKL